MFDLSKFTGCIGIIEVRKMYLTSHHIRNDEIPDDLKIRQPQDSKRINVNESWEVRYWTQKLGVSEAQLKQAVKAIGHHGGQGEGISEGALRQ